SELIVVATALKPLGQPASRQLAAPIGSVAPAQCRPTADLPSALSRARSVAASFLFLQQRLRQHRSESIRGSNRRERLLAAKPICHLLAKSLLLTLAVRKRPEAIAKASRLGHGPR